jgi:L-threonylcarbamoyladenylate synthase
LPVAPRASGTLQSHYAPRAKVRLLGARALEASLQAVAKADAAVPPAAQAPLGIYARSLVAQARLGLVWHSMPSTAAQTAQELFAVLRMFDDAGVHEIWVESVPDAPEWAGVADRLQRASATVAVTAKAT